MAEVTSVLSHDAVVRVYLGRLYWCIPTITGVHYLSDLVAGACLAY